MWHCCCQVEPVEGLFFHLPVARFVNEDEDDGVFHFSALSWDVIHDSGFRFDGSRTQLRCLRCLIVLLFSGTLSSSSTRRHLWNAVVVIFDNHELVPLGNHRADFNDGCALSGGCCCRCYCCYHDGGSGERKKRGGWYFFYPTKENEKLFPPLADSFHICLTLPFSSSVSPSLTSPLPHSYALTPSLLHSFSFSFSPPFIFFPIWLSNEHHFLESKKQRSFEVVFITT